MGGVAGPVTESAGAKETVGQVVVPRQRNVDLPFSGGRGTTRRGRENHLRYLGAV